MKMKTLTTILGFLLLMICLQLGASVSRTVPADELTLVSETVAPSVPSTTTNRYYGYYRGYYGYYRGYYGYYRGYYGSYGYYGYYGSYRPYYSYYSYYYWLH
jgi:hypothetical protein